MSSMVSVRRTSYGPFWTDTPLPAPNADVFVGDRGMAAAFLALGDAEGEDDLLPRLTSAVTILGVECLYGTGPDGITDVLVDGEAVTEAVVRGFLAEVAAI